MNTFGKTMIGLGMALGLAGMAWVPQARAHTSISIGIGIPLVPPPIIEPVPGVRVGFIWAPGYWNWAGRRYAWVPGHWRPRGYGYRHERYRHWDHRSLRGHDGHWNRGNHGGRSHGSWHGRGHGYHH